MLEAEYLRLRANIDMADDLFSGLPDGAYWAACAEVGASSDIQIEVDEYEREHKLGVYEL